MADAPAEKRRRVDVALDDGNDPAPAPEPVKQEPADQPSVPQRKLLRNELPIDRCREELMRIVAENTFVVITGDTVRARGGAAVLREPDGLIHRAG
jgi:HrpA-like RNA helicase